MSGAIPLSHFSMTEDPETAGQRWREWRQNFLTHINSLTTETNTVTEGLVNESETDAEKMTEAEKVKLLIEKAGPEVEAIINSCPKPQDQTLIAYLEILNGYFCSDEHLNSTSVQTKSKGSNTAIKCVIGGTLGAAGLMLAAPLAIAAVGFGSGGIVGGSIAASMMSSAAVANGGGVAAGSLVAVLQSAGAAGLAASTYAGLGAAGAAIGTGGTAATTFIRNIITRRNGEEENKGNDQNKNKGNDQEENKGNDQEENKGNDQEENKGND